MSGYSFVLFIFTACAVGAMANAAGLLQPASFPKTVQDISFIDRMNLKAEGYDPYESVYDENGNCISGCAYPGIKLEDELKAIERATNLARQKMEQYQFDHPEQFQPQPPHDDTPEPEKPPVRPPVQPHVEPHPETPPQPDPAMCQYRTDKIVPRDIINQAPLVYPYKISSRFGPRRSFTTTNGNQATKVHKGIDLSAPTGTEVYAAANGTVTKVENQPNGCGLWIQIDHINGFSTQYCHLSKQLAKVGDRVQAGCLIGRVGTTGNVTGPHLHYVVKQNGVPIDPEPYLK